MLALAVACGLPAHQASPTLRRNPDHFLETQLGLDAAGHTYAAAIERDATGERLVVRVSDDYGMQWPQVASFAAGPIGSRRHLDLCTGAPGEVYVVWIEEQNGPPDVRFTRSLDGGKTWLPEDRRLSGQPSASARAVYPVVRSDDRGNVYVVWLDDREGFAALYVNRSRDGGDTWLPWDRRLTSLAIGRKSAPEFDCDRDGNLYVAWTEEFTNSRRIVTNVSNDYGETWGIQELPISTGASATQAKIVALDGGTAVAAWLEPARGGGRVFCARTTDRGLTWETPRALGTTTVGTASPPRLLRGERNEVYIAWQVTNPSTATRIVLASSRDAGARFGELVFERSTGLGPGLVDLEGYASEVPIAAVADRAGNVYFSWVETTVGVARLGFDRVGNFGRSWIRAQPALDMETRLDVGFPENSLPDLVPSIAADDFGHVCLLWNLGHTLLFATSPFNGDSSWTVQSF